MVSSAPMVSFAPTVYKQFNKPTLTISHCPCKIKLDAFYFIFCMFYVTARASVQEPFLTYESATTAIRYLSLLHPFRGPPLQMLYQLLQERQTPASHIYGTSHMSGVEPVSRKSTRKVGTGRFIQQYRDINKYTREGNKCRIDAHIQHVF